MVVDGYGQNALGFLLPDNVLVQDFIDFCRYGKLGIIALRGRLLYFFPNDVVTEIYALVTDEHRRPGNQLANLVLAFAAKRAIQQLAVIA